MRPLADSGHPFDAEFEIESDGDRLALVLKSAGGKIPGRTRSRNSDYVPALEALLARLAYRSAVIEAAVVASAKVRDRPQSELSLIDGPIALHLGVDVADLRKMLTTRQGRIGQAEGAKSDGNNRKRIRLILDVPDYGPGDSARLGEDLRSPIYSADRVLDGIEAVDSTTKAITVLWACGRLAAGDGPLFVRSEFAAEVAGLIAEFGSATTVDPLVQLGSHPDFWELPTEAEAGFTAGAATLLTNPVIREQAIGILKRNHLRVVADLPALLDRVGVTGRSPIVDIGNAVASMTGTKLRVLPPDTLDQLRSAVHRFEQADLRMIIVGSGDTATCALCGHEFPLRYLVAAHIKPRSQCTDGERRDLQNVAMPACVFGCDMLFETGHITVDPTGLIRTGAAHPDGRFADLVMSLSGTMCAAHRDETEPYFAWHRTNRFLGLVR
ncbi:Conserved domain protein [Alloactinosynnema sp. L-07]|uniref:HNH endonuclease signature motif containing protein n=1 Tax=Alloactinosynnema sp. L-07 TaxID=1653480 RepID=UPI00065EF221|nr:HNH endonuclease signature motif containing protein [Alloactinosynnema sp. L-07]CRK55978.1 Conserved domain protein [Alloactinosynnema sp. L-07]